MQEKIRKNKGLGDSGENLAAKYLAEQGFEIVGRNVRYKTGEIDIIAKRGGELHFIEVKTRIDPELVPPLEAVTKWKISHIKNTAQMYLLDRRNNFKEGDLPPCFYDVIAVDYASGEPKVECVMDAFY